MKEHTRPYSSAAGGGFILAPNGSEAHPVDSTDQPWSIYPLILVALIVDLLFPFLIWKGIAPAPVRWISHGCLVLMMVLVYARMMVTDRFPIIVWLVISASAIWLEVALANGQDALATAWGWWVMFQYPFVGLFAYLQPRWPKRFPEVLRKSAVSLLGLEVLVQVGQYLTGVRPGDQLAGTFGRNGTGDLIIFVVLVLCIALGHLLDSGCWNETAIVLILAIASSTLGEMKLFLPASLLIMLIGVMVYVLRKKQVWRIIPFVLVIGIVSLAFIRLYDTIVPGANKGGIENRFDNPSAIMNYLDFKHQYVSNGQVLYEVGRNTALGQGWDAIQSDGITLLFGMGLGTSGESVTLGTSGMGLKIGNGLIVPTSLLVMMQETGIVGLAILAILYVWLIFTLSRGILSEPESRANELRFALLLFSLLWPIWLWYNTAWTLRVPMLLYWVALGYVLSQSRRNINGQRRKRIQAIETGMSRR